MILIDSSFWIEYFNGSDFGKIIWENVDFKKRNFLVPTIVVFEVHKKLSLEYNKELADAYTNSFQNGKVIELDFSLALLASKYSKEYKLPLADSIIYATAKKYSAEVFTLDKHFKDLPLAKYFEK